MINQDALDLLQESFPNLNWQCNASSKNYGTYWAIFAKNWELRIDIYPLGCISTLSFGSNSFGKYHVISSGTEKGKSLVKVIEYTRARWDEIERELFSAMAPTKIKVDPRISLGKYLEKEGFEIQIMGGCKPYKLIANHYSGFSIYFRTLDSIAIFDVCDKPFSFSHKLSEKKSFLFMQEWQLSDNFNGANLNDSDAFYLIWMMWSDVKDLVLE